MATMIEKRLASLKKEAEKLQTQLQKRTALLEKKLAKAEKLGIKDWTSEDFRYHTLTLKDTTDKQYELYFSLSITKNDVKETEERIELNRKALENIIPQVENIKKEQDEDERIANMETKFFQMTAEEKAKREAEYKAWLKWFKAECLKDGVIIEEVTGWGISGKTKSGKSFSLYGNNGFTKRSFHCYTFYLDGQMIFTSGEFGTAYKDLKK